MQIAVIGDTSTASVAAACLADLGHQVTLASACDTPAALNSEEEGFTSFFETQVLRGRLCLGTLASAAASHAIVFLAIEPGNAPSGMIEQAKTVVAYMPVGSLLVLHAGPQPGTAEAVKAAITTIRPNSGISLVSNPPFGRPGCAARDFMNPDRIVIGTDNIAAARQVARLYRRRALEDAVLVYTSHAGAELIAQASTSYAAMKAAFIQHLALMCETMSVSLADVGRGIDLDRRVGKTVLSTDATAGNPHSFLNVAGADLPERDQGTMYPAWRIAV